MGNIVWLASYPKSGNTWFRIFLTNLFNNNDKPADINNLYPTQIASNRQLFDEISGISSADLNPDEIEYIRRYIYITEAQQSNCTIYHKIHDAWTILSNGKPMIPYEVTKGVIYFIRNPLDIAISFANHLNSSIDRTIEIMNNPDFAFCGSNRKLYNQTKQHLLTWSMHVESWIEKSKLPIIVLKYEDMKEKTFETFKKAIEFLQLDYNDIQIKKAIEFSSFEIVKKQEIEKGFKEKSIKTKHFFRKGSINEWKKKLTKRQIKEIIKHHSYYMKKFEYL